MRSKNSVIARPVKSEAQRSSVSTPSVSVAEPERRSLQALSKSQVFPVNTNKQSNSTNPYASFNGHAQPNKRNPSTSSVTDHSRTSSIPDPSDSDIDSYSDIVGQRSWKDSVNHQSVDSTGGSSPQNSQQGVTNVNLRSWASSENPAGSVISFSSHQRRAIEDLARTAKPNSKRYESGMNGTRQSVPNLSTINGDAPLPTHGAYRGRAQRRSWSESQDPVLPNGSRSVAYGRSKSIPRQTGNESSDEEELGHVRQRRWKGSSKDLRVNRVVVGASRTNEPQHLRVTDVDLPVRSDSRTSRTSETERLRVSNVDSPVRSDSRASRTSETERLRVSNVDSPVRSDSRASRTSETERLRVSNVDLPVRGESRARRTSETEPLRVSNVDSPVRGESLRSPGNRSAVIRNGDVRANHAEQLAAEMQQGRTSSLHGRKKTFPRFRDDSQSSQDSTDYESRQTAAERAAAALMSNHVTHAPAQPPTNKQNPQRYEMRDMDSEHRRLKREHLANLAHLQSSSC